MKLLPATFMLSYFSPCRNPFPTYEHFHFLYDVDRSFVMSGTSTCDACMQEVWPDVSSGFVCVKTSKVQPVCACCRL